MRNIILYLLIFFTLAGCAQHKKITQKKSKKSTPKSVVKPKTDSKLKDTDTVFLSNKADSIIDFASKYLGTKYKYGGEDINGFDCAGFVCFVYRNFNIKLPRTADAQALLGKEVDRKTMRKGDLIFFKGRNVSSNAIGHVGIVIENNSGSIKFISATVSAGVHVDDIDGPYWKERFVVAKRILISK